VTTATTVVTTPNKIRPAGWGGGTYFLAVPLLIPKSSREKQSNNDKAVNGTTGLPTRDTRYIYVVRGAGVSRTAHEVGQRGVQVVGHQLAGQMGNAVQALTG